MYKMKQLFFLNTRPRGTNIWREALLFDRAKDAIEYSRNLDMDVYDFIVINANSRVFAGNTANMAFLNTKKAMLRRFLDKGGDTESTTCKSIKRNVDELEQALRKTSEYYINFIIDGIKQ